MVGGAMEEPEARESKSLARMETHSSVEGVKSHGGDPLDHATEPMVVEP